MKFTSILFSPMWHSCLLMFWHTHSLHLAICFLSCCSLSKVMTESFIHLDFDSFNWDAWQGVTSGNSAAPWLGTWLVGAALDVTLSVVGMVVVSVGKAGRRFAHAVHCFTGGGCKGAVGGFKLALGFNDAAAGMCDSMDVTTVVIYMLSGHCFVGKWHGDGSSRFRGHWDATGWCGIHSGWGDVVGWCGCGKGACCVQWGFAWTHWVSDCAGFWEGHDLVALGIISQVDTAVVGSAVVGLSLGMAGASLASMRFMVGEGECWGLFSHPTMVGIIVAVWMMAGSVSGISSSMSGDAPSHLTLNRVIHNVRTSGAEFSNISYHSLACKFECK